MYNQQVSHTPFNAFFSITMTLLLVYTFTYPCTQNFHHIVFSSYTFFPLSFKEAGWSTTYSFCKIIYSKILICVHDNDNFGHKQSMSKGKNQVGFKTWTFSNNIFNYRALYQKEINIVLTWSQSISPLNCIHFYTYRYVLVYIYIC